KNVTGYDLCKVVAGSWGTLAALTEVTIKVMPRPETEETLVLFGLDAKDALKAMSEAMNAPCDVSGAAHLPPAIARRVAGGAGAEGSLTALRLEGVPASIAHRRGALEALLRQTGNPAVLDERRSAALWQGVRDVTPFAAERSAAERSASEDADRALWRISTAPARGAELGAMLADAEVLYDWAGGLVWALLPPADDGGASAVRRAVAACGGHA